MKSKTFKSLFTLVFVFLCMLVFQTKAYAIPYDGKEFELKQPDSSQVKVRVFGDEFYQRVESMEGYTLIRDPKTDWICYAELNSDGSDFVSTGIPYSNALKNSRNSSADIQKLKIEKGLKLSTESVKKKVQDVQESLNWDKFLEPRIPSSSAKGLQYSASPLQGTVNGLTLLIDFPDVKSAIPRDEIDHMFNQPGYSGFGNNGSVRDYYYDISGGKLTYTNTVTLFYTAKNPKSYYDNTTDTTGLKARELISEALQSFSDKGMDFSNLTLDQYGDVMCLNVMYAGSPDSGWSKGLWPHSSYLNKTYGGVSFGRYQISNIGTSLEIGTPVHENGHMLCGWDDTYDYGYESYGCGNYDVMSTPASKNPCFPNPYFRNILSGWGNTIKLTNVTSTLRYPVYANSIDSYLFQTSSNNEFFLIENMQKSGRRANAPDEGLLIWHIDTYGSNDFEDMTLSSHYEVSVEQADGLYDLERNSNRGGSGDLFHAGYVDSFTPATAVNSNKWDGTPSGLDISQVSSPGDVMIFSLNPNEADVQKPGAPTNLVCTERTANAVVLSWTASTDNVGVTGYDIYGRLSGGHMGSTTDATTFTVTGLKPERTYEFTVTAKDAAGNKSEESIPVTVKTAPASVNLALNKTAASSSNDDSGRTADKAFDGDSSTRWSSQYTDSEWLSVDLGTVCTIDSVILNWEVAYGKSYEIQVSDDGNTWTDVYSEESGDGGTDDISFSPVGARYVRMQGVQRGSQWGYSLYEFEVYGHAGTDSVSPTPPANFRCTSVSGSSITLNWDAASDNVGVTAYKVYNLPTHDVYQLIGSTEGGTEITLNGLTPDIYYYIAVTASDAAGNESNYSNWILIKIQSP